MKKKFFATHEWIYIKQGQKKNLREFNVPLNISKLEVQNILKSIYGFNSLKINSLIRKGDRKTNSKNLYRKQRKSYKKIRITIHGE